MTFGFLNTKESLLHWIMYNFKNTLSFQSQITKHGSKTEIWWRRDVCLFFNLEHSIHSAGKAEFLQSELDIPFEIMQNICWSQHKICLKSKSQSWLLWRRVVSFAILQWCVFSHSWRKVPLLLPLVTYFSFSVSPILNSPWCSWLLFLISSQLCSSHPLHSQYVIS